MHAPANASAFAAATAASRELRRDMYMAASSHRRGARDHDRLRRTLVCILAGAFASVLTLCIAFVSTDGRTRSISRRQVFLKEDSTTNFAGSANLAAADGGGGGVVPTFVFLIGLEGAGQQLAASMLGRSGNMRMVADRLKCTPPYDGGEFHKLAYLFFSGGGEGGLFNPRGGKNWDSRGFFRGIADTLATIGRAVKEEAAKAGGGGPRYVYVPANANGCTKANMASYPSYLGRDRLLQSPSLDIYYDACREAGVRCKHAYLYRDPYAVIASAQEKKFNANALDGIRLYTAAMHLIYAQMLFHRGGNAGCFGFLDPEGSKRTEDMERFGALFGFDDIVSIYNEVMTEDIAPMAEDERQRLVPPEWDVLMKAFVDAHQRVIDLCYSAISE